MLGDDADAEALDFLRKGLTSEMVAAVAKLCSNADLIYGAKKMPVIKRANTTIGLPGRFSARLQPNDTRDDVKASPPRCSKGCPSAWATR